MLRSLAQSLGDERSLKAIKKRQIDEWMGLLLQRGLKPQTINSYLRHVGAALSTAMDWGYLDTLPRLKPIREPTRPPRHLTLAEIHKLLATDENPDRCRLWVFFLCTGTRRQELVNLCWEHVTLGQKPFAYFLGKGQKTRIVPLIPAAVEALGEPRDIGPVFIFNHGRRSRPRPVKGWAYSSWFKELARKVGLPDARLHDLRHTSITFMLDQGVHQRIVQKVVEHASITTTERYAQGLVAHLYDAVTSHWNDNILTTDEN